MTLYLNKLIPTFKKKKHWKDIEYFDPGWEERVALMAQFIESGKSVLDLGCGKMHLRKYLVNCTYYPVDYTKRSEDCIICDFNKREFPAIKPNIVFISGCLEYVKPYRWFITSACRQSERIIISYCTTDKFTDRRERESLAWVNHLSEEKILGLFKTNGFKLSHSLQTKTNNSIFVFDRL